MSDCWVLGSSLRSGSYSSCSPPGDGKSCITTWHIAMALMAETKPQCCQSRHWSVTMNKRGLSSADYEWCLFCSVGAIREHSASYFEPNGDTGDTAHLLQTQQVHQRFPAPHWCVRRGLVQGGQSCSLHHHHVPFPFCRHVSCYLYF